MRGPPVTPMREFGPPEAYLRTSPASPSAAGPSPNRCVIVFFVGRFELVVIAVLVPGQVVSLGVDHRLRHGRLLDRRRRHRPALGHRLDVDHDAAALAVL